jgi:CBS domain-containing protein
MSFEEALKKEKIRNLSTRQAVTAAPGESLGEVTRKMQEKRTGCAVILEDKKIVGIFTERDALLRGLIAGADLATPIEKLMTPKPKLLDREDSIAVAVRLMNDGHYRHLPVVNSKKEFLGLVSVRDIVLYLSENFATEVFNLPPDPHQVSSSAEGA